MQLIVALILIFALALVASDDDAAANGREVQREVVGRVVAVHAGEGTVEVEREFRGKVWRLTLRVPEGAVIFTCEQTAATLAELRPGSNSAGMGIRINSQQVFARLDDEGEGSWA